MAAKMRTWLNVLWVAFMIMAIAIEGGFVVMFLLMVLCFALGI